MCPTITLRHDHGCLQGPAREPQIIINWRESLFSGKTAPRRAMPLGPHGGPVSTAAQHGAMGQRLTFPLWSAALAAGEYYVAVDRFAWSQTVSNSAFEITFAENCSCALMSASGGIGTSGITSRQLSLA